MPDSAHEPTDADLVASVNGGDWTAFDQLYHRYRDRTYRLAWRFCGDENDALDVVQDVFVYLAGKFRQRSGLELRAGLMTLLYPAVKHTALALKKKRRRMAGMPDDLDVAAPPRTASAEESRVELAAALTTLSNDHREVLLMRFVDDMTLEEMAHALAIPLGTAKSRLHHAIAGVRNNPQLRQYFENF